MPQKSTLIGICAFLVACGGDRPAPQPQPQPQPLPQVQSISGSSGDICSFVSDYNPDNKDAQYCQESAHFFTGKIGDVAIEMDMYHTRVWGDTAWVEGSYWYNNIYQPIGFQGFYSIKDYTLILKHDGNQETFELAKFDGKSATGTWKKGDKSLPCSVKVIPTADFNLADALEQINLKAFEKPILPFISINTFAGSGTKALRINQDSAEVTFAEDDYEGLNLERFDMWQVEIVPDFASGSKSQYFIWQRLAANTPTILYVDMYRSLGPYTHVNPDGEKLSTTGNFYSINDFLLFTYRNGKWEKQPLPELITQIDEIVGDAPDIEVVIAPNHLRFHKGVWLWDGTKFKKK